MLELFFSDSVTWLDVVFTIMTALGAIIFSYGLLPDIKGLRVIGLILVWTGGVYTIVRFVICLFLK